MKVFKRTLSLLLCIVMMLSMLAVIATAQAFAEEKDVADTSAVASADSFSWDNATVYFVLTDRFVNGDTSNDHSYNRLVDHRTGQVVSSSQLNNDGATFHGGDFKGLTQKIEEGYFDDLGVNAIWMSAPYEQIHGFVATGNSKASQMPHYAYHGYYALDYTQTDANFGTAQEFKKLVDTAHEHGIRVVLDIVMNHPGYNTYYDMFEYDFGAFNISETEAWNLYYNWKKNDTLSNATNVNYEGAGATEGWAKWWGKDWLRAGLGDYTRPDGSDLTGSAGGYLPDFRTENTATVSIPIFLQNKWKKEGRYDSKVAAANAWFSKTGNSKTVRNYLVYWLSEWVREYGVDGFRCDTAKHVELQSWKALSDECTKALNEWRANNKGKVEAASWTDDFWMTAEDYGYGMGSKDSYYTQGGFDSKINFAFTGGNGVPGSGEINNIYSNYANKINSDSSYNVLTYISSHDTALCRNDLIYQGSAFQLMPGAIQIFYGDESNRPLANGNFSGATDHQLRSDMNWNSLDQNVLKHWQKVGTFRNSHVAVGAGTHSSITATNGVAFAREYNKNGVSDTVFAVIAANKNTNITLTVGSYVEDGTVLKNTYDDSTATVSGGKVTFNSGANGTILVEVAGASSKPDVSVSHTGGNFADTLTITATLNEYATSGTYQIGSAKAVKFTKSATITIGDDMDFNESVTIKFTATDGTDTKERNYTYKKIDPNASPFTFPTDQTTYLLDTAKWGKANCYTWITNGAENAGWPGIAMEKVGEYEGADVYSFEVASGHENLIFNDGSAQTDNLTFTANSYYDNGAKKWVEVEVVKPIPTTPTQTEPSETTKPTSATVATTPTANGDIILGDTDLDSDITILDATMVQRHLAKLITLSDDQLLAGNVDYTDELTILDATHIQRWLAKLDVSFPVGEVYYTKETEAPTQATQATEPTQSGGSDSNYNTVYVDMGSTDVAYAYYWTDGGDKAHEWPGVAMEHVTGNIYTAEVPKQYNRIIFSHNAANQTADLEIKGDGYIYNKGNDQWTVYNGSDNPTPTPTPTNPGGNDNLDFSNPRTIYVINDGEWPQVCIHYWNTSYGTEWPGESMNKIGTLSGHDLYSFTLNDDINEFIVNIGSNQTQSANLTIPSGQQVFLTSSMSFVDASNY